MKISLFLETTDEIFMSECGISNFQMIHMTYTNTENTANY